MTELASSRLQFSFPSTTAFVTESIISLEPYTCEAHERTPQQSNFPYPTTPHTTSALTRQTSEASHPLTLIKRLAFPLSWH